MSVTQKDYARDPQGDKSVTGTLAYARRPLTSPCKPLVELRQRLAELVQVLAEPLGSMALVGFCREGTHFGRVSMEFGQAEVLWDQFWSNG